MFLRSNFQVADIDVVIGGHSHSFLYTGEAPSVETPEGEYPTYITQVNFPNKSFFPGVKFSFHLPE